MNHSILTAFGAATAVLGNLSPSAAAQSSMAPYVAQALPFDQRLAVLSEDSDKTLAVQKFDADWVRTLDQRGEPMVYTRANSADFDFIGMPVGGIGAGQLYLGGDGKLWCWDIFNAKVMRDVRGVGKHANPYQRSEPDRRAHHQLNQGFALRLENSDDALIRTLDRDGFRRQSQAQLPPSTAPELGKGCQVQLWHDAPAMLAECADYLDNFVDALARTISAGGDCDTNAAIVGGIVAAGMGVHGIPEDWRAACESIPLPRAACFLAK